MYLSLSTNEVSRGLLASRQVRPGTGERGWRKMKPRVAGPYQWGSMNTLYVLIAIFTVWVEFAFVVGTRDLWKTESVKANRIY